MKIYILEAQTYEGNEILTVSTDKEYIETYINETIEDAEEYEESIYLILSIWQNNVRLNYYTDKKINDFFEKNIIR